MSAVVPDLWAIITTIRNHLETQRGASAIPGLTSTRIGDEGHPFKVAAYPVLTVDVEEEDFSKLRTGNAGGALDVTLAVRIYVAGPSGDIPAAQLVQQIWSTEGGTKGVRAALLAFPPKLGFILVPQTGRRIREQDVPGSKFSAGWEARVIARLLAR